MNLGLVIVFFNFNICRIAGLAVMWFPLTRALLCGWKCDIIFRIKYLFNDYFFLNLNIKLKFIFVLNFEIFLIQLLKIKDIVF